MREGHHILPAESNEYFHPAHMRSGHITQLLQKLPLQILAVRSRQYHNVRMYTCGVHVYTS